MSQRQSPDAARREQQRQSRRGGIVATARQSRPTKSKASRRRDLDFIARPTRVTLAVAQPVFAELAGIFCGRGINTVSTGFCKNQKSSVFQGQTIDLPGSGGGTRTPDPRIMIPVL
jgi:hypothetical protein